MDTVGHNIRQVTIASGASLSAALGLSSMTLLAIQMPAAWTAAAITFSVSYDGITFADMYGSDGTETSVTVSTSRYVVLDPAVFAGVEYLKVRSGTSGTPVAQGAERTLTLITARILG